MDYHKYIFHGQSFNLILYSISKYDPHVYLKWKKRNFKNVSQQDRNKHEKLVELNLENLTYIFNLLKNQQNLRDITIKERLKGDYVTFSWENENTRSLWIRANSFSKVLNFPQIQLLLLLIEHLLHEKIAFSTSNSKNINRRLFEKDNSKEALKKTANGLYFE